MESISNKNMILRPQDLRVGNYINYENTTHVVSELHQEKIIHHWIKHNGDGYVTRYDQILSIPLSVREIENLGFQEDFNRIKYVEGFYDDNGYLIEHYGDIFWFCRHNNKYDFERLVPVDFVHELQNLYFLFTKKELTFS